MTVGLDLGDRFSSACALDTDSGGIKSEWRMATTGTGLARHFEGQPPIRIALEVGTHSPWVGRLLGSWGHEVLVANPRKVRLIAHNRRKSDRFDGRTLARLARLDPELLSSVRWSGVRDRSPRRRRCGSCGKRVRAFSKELREPSSASAAPAASTAI